MQFDILNRYSDKVQCTAEINCGVDASTSFKIGLAVKWARKSGADLRGADLDGADLGGADLGGADLIGANLGGQGIIQGATRSDGYAFFLQTLTGDAEPMVRAGCRYFTLQEAQEHWEKTRAGTALLAETRAIIRCMVEIAHARGFMTDGKTAP